jgi:negative regulator of flagellin synthesis FlgM
MKIGHLESKVPAKPASGERSATAAGKSTTPAEAEASANVQLSSAASLLVGGDHADFDTKKVERIAQAIRDGKFSVNPEAIADKLISNAQELISRPSH